MGKRHHNPRLPKIHRNYTVEEIASLLAVHRNTVRHWIKGGLPTTDEGRPLLVLGRELARFLADRRQLGKRPCGAGEIYCVRCRVPTKPAGGVVEYKPLTTLLGDLVGRCPRCAALLYRRVNRLKLAEVRGELRITLPQAVSHITTSSEPSSNSDFTKEAADRGN